MAESKGGEKPGKTDPAKHKPHQLTDKQRNPFRRGEPYVRRSSTTGSVEWTEKGSNLLEMLADTVEPTQELIDYVQYGLLSTSTHRERFLKISQYLDDQARGMVITFCCAENNKQAILSNLNIFPNDTSWLPAAKSFVSERLVQDRPPDNEHVFTISLVPLSFPGHDILTWCHFAPIPELNLETLAKRITFCQVRLDADLQARAQAGHQSASDAEVTKHNEAREKLPPDFRDKHYQHLMSDNHLLFNVEGGEWDPGRPYNQEDIEMLLQDFKDKRPLRV